MYSNVLAAAACLPRNKCLSYAIIKPFTHLFLQYICFHFLMFQCKSLLEFNVRCEATFLQVASTLVHLHVNQPLLPPIRRNI